MNAILRHGGPALLALSMVACTRSPQVNAPVLAAAAPAQRLPIAPANAANDADGGDTAASDAETETQAEADLAPAVADVALDHAGQVLLGQRYSDLTELGQWQEEGALALNGLGCTHVTGEWLPEGVSMMVQDDVVVRFDLEPGSASDTEFQPVGPFGLTSGMAQAEALRRLPAGAVFTPHAYDPGVGQYLTWDDPRSDLAIRLEIFGGVVSSMYWGSSEPVKLKEGCA